MTILNRMMMRIFYIFKIFVSNVLGLRKPNRHVTLELNKDSYSFGIHGYKELDEVIRPNMTIHGQIKVTEIRKEYMMIIKVFHKNSSSHVLPGQ